MADCTIVGNDAMYGLGIRLGLYFQWASTVLSLGWVPSQVKAMRDTNAYFTISTIISLIYVSVNHQSSASEIITVLSLCSGGAYASVAAQKYGWVLGFAIPGVGRRSTALLQNMIFLTLAYYQIWLFYRGLDSVGFSSCTQYEFFFAKVSVYGWLRTYHKVIWTMGVMLPTICLCLSFFFEGDEDDSPSQQDPAVRISCAICAVTFLAKEVLNAELTIRWNNIQGVQNMGSTGQMIPLIIGVLGFIKTCYTLIRDIYEERKDRARNVRNVKVHNNVDVKDGGTGGDHVHVTITDAVELNRDAVEDSIVRST